MDVRCEKCQTEYELDEARLKPGGVTVKCTNCGHMFKIRKRSTTNVGQPAVTAVPAAERARPVSSKQPLRAAAAAPVPTLTENEKETVVAAVGGGVDGELGAPGASGERQWLIRLENGETKSCRELATLQQWIVAGVATRESLISRSGKTWKRLGDIAELASYFTIADEARATRTERATKPPADKKAATALPLPAPPTVAAAAEPTRKVDDKKVGGQKSPTMMGIGAVASAAGGTILPDDDDGRSTARRQVSVPPPMPPTRTPAMGAPMITKTPPMGAPVPPRAVAAPAGALATSPTIVASTTPAQQTELATGAPLPRRPATQPPPPPVGKRTPGQSQSGPLPHPPPPIPGGNRSTAGWANDAVREISGDDDGGPKAFSGKIATTTGASGPAFASGKLGTVRGKPGSDGVFQTGKIEPLDDDDDMLVTPRGSSAGKWIAVGALIVMGAVAAAIYFAVIHKSPKVAVVQIDAGAVVALAADAAVVAPPVAPDAAVVALPPTDVAAAELGGDVETRLRTALTSLDGKDDAPALAMRARLAVSIAQDLQDRAGLIADKAESDKLRTEAKQLVLDAAPLAQRALKADAGDPSANLAMADVLRVQGKSVREIRRYLDAARAKAGSDKQITRSAALADALVLARDGKLADAQLAFAAIDRGDDALDKSGDVRARFHQALALTALGHPADAKPLVESILALQPDHLAARALSAKLATTVATSDPLPPEDGQNPATPRDAGAGSAVAVGPSTHPGSDANPGPGSGAVTSPGSGQAPTHEPVTGPGEIVGGGDYDKLVAKGNQTAESNCEQAIKMFEAALVQKPNGVEALTGMGYCHIDAKQFASAFSNFRAALAVSPRNERALWGMAEGYQQQGRAEQAIDSYKAYLAVYPDSAAARRQLARLGVDTSATPAGGSATPPPTTPPPTTPPPTTPPPVTPPATTPTTPPVAPAGGDQPVTTP